MLDTAFILAAGLGTRMRPLTAQTAKPLLYFRGERLIERHLRLLSGTQIERVIINCSWYGQQLRQLLGDGDRFDLDIFYSCEDNDPLETASGLARASYLLAKKPFLLLNGDVWTDLDLQSLITTSACPRIVLVKNPNHNPQGDFSLTTAGEVQTTGTNKLTYAGIGIMHSNMIERALDRGDKLGSTLRKTAELGELTGYLHGGEWFDIGRPAAVVA